VSPVTIRVEETVAELIDAVGIVAVPVNVGLAKVAYAWFFTKAVVANKVELLFVDGVVPMAVPAI
jgi:hypothetical protein